MTNFLSQPSIEAIQTLLVIGNVLSYNMNPGVSYVLLGELEDILASPLRKRTYSVNQIKRNDSSNGIGPRTSCGVKPILAR